MSTKIYNAYRVEAGVDLFDVLHDIRATAWARCRKVIDGRNVEMLHAAYVGQLGSSHRSDWDLDVSIAVHSDRSRWLLRAFAGSGLFSEVLDFLPKHESLEDWHYQNSTDRPANLSAIAWNARQRSWDRAFARMLTFEIVSPSLWSSMRYAR